MLTIFFSPNDDNKRQRKESGSSASSNGKAFVDEVEDDREDGKAPASSSAQTVRGAAAQNRRNKELRERDEKRERDRADAAGRRKGRAERRRGDGKVILHTSSSTETDSTPRIRSIRRTNFEKRLFKRQRPDPNTNAPAITSTTRRKSIPSQEKWPSARSPWPSRPKPIHTRPRHSTQRHTQAFSWRCLPHPLPQLQR